MNRNIHTTAFTPRIFGALLLCLALCSGCAEASQAGSPMGIHVSGQGTLEVAPDMGTVQLHVRREGIEADVLTAELNRVVGQTIALAERLGIAERDIQATSLTIHPRYQRRGNESVVDGLVATRSIALVLRDLNIFAELLSEALTLGVNNVDPIRLDSSERASLENEALTLAMDDAKAEAARVAEGFDVTLGAVTDVQVGAHSPRPEVMRAAAFADSGSSFSSGVIRIDRSVSVTFSIIPSG
jgi:uncharacterized protein YggE